MEKRFLIPGTDLSVYPIGLGTVDAGLRWDGADADRIFDTYLGQGGNLIDCAHVYSDWVPDERRAQSACWAIGSPAAASVMRLRLSPRAVIPTWSARTLIPTRAA